MATHSSVLAWRIPGTGEPGGLPSLGLHRVGHDWSDLAAAAAAATYVYLQLVYIVVQQKPAQHCKAIIFQLKKNRDNETTVLHSIYHLMFCTLYDVNITT